MIDNYGLFNRHEIDDTLLILLNDLPVTTRVSKGEVDVLLHNQEVCGYSIKHFIRYAKIKYSGIIFLPSKPLVNVINSVLSKYDLEPINYRKNSGYAVKINEKGQKMVFANLGTFLRDGTVSKGRFCTYYDLYIKSENEQELIVIEDDVEEGIDFFLMEEK